MVALTDTPAVTTREVEQPPVFVRSACGRLLVTEPQNLQQERFEQIDREYQELAEAWER